MTDCNPAEEWSSTQPLYQQVYQQLREHVLEECGPGQRLLAERKLATRMQVAPMTVARALLDRQREGLVRRIPRKGTFVLDAVSTSASRSDGGGYGQMAPRGESDLQ